MAVPLLDVRDLQKEFVRQSGWLSHQKNVVRAVEDVSFQVQRAETFGLVGESGCGKSTVARCILRLIRPTAGRVLLDGEDLLSMPPARLRDVRRELQLVFQDPYASLDPRLTIRRTLLQPLEIHQMGTRSDRENRVRELVELVGMGPGALAKYPHEFSGGQRQRIVIARALALSPRLVVADEPVSALDLSIRAQVTNLMADLQERLGVSYLFIAHDLTLVRHVCHRVAVMYRGKIVELADVEELFENPLHSYTRQLLQAIPLPDPHQRQSRPSAVTTVPDEGSAVMREVLPGHWVRGI